MTEHTDDTDDLRELVDEWREEARDNDPFKQDGGSERIATLVDCAQQLEEELDKNEPEIDRDDSDVVEFELSKEDFGKVLSDVHNYVQKIETAFGEDQGLGYLQDYLRKNSDEYVQIEFDEELPIIELLDIVEHERKADGDRGVDYEYISNSLDAGWRLEEYAPFGSIGMGCPTCGKEWDYEVIGSSVCPQCGYDVCRGDSE